LEGVVLVLKPSFSERARHIVLVTQKELKQEKLLPRSWKIIDAGNAACPGCTWLLQGFRGCVATKELRSIVTGGEVIATLLSDANDPPAAGGGLVSVTYRSSVGEGSNLVRSWKTNHSWQKLKDVAVSAGPEVALVTGLHHLFGFVRVDQAFCMDRVEIAVLELESVATAGRVMLGLAQFGEQDSLTARVAAEVLTLAWHALARITSSSGMRAGGRNVMLQGDRSSNYKSADNESQLPAYKKQRTSGEMLDKFFPV
jgi:hypothetical protein